MGMHAFGDEAHHCFNIGRLKSDVTSCHILDYYSSTC